MRYISEMERDATWMSENTWAAKHGSANLNLWYEIQYKMRINIEMEYVDDWSCTECGHTGISEAEDACPECDSTWAVKHGSANLNLWYEMQYNMRVNSKPWWDDSDMEGDTNNA